MQKKIRFHKHSDYDLIYLLRSCPEYPIADVIRNCVKSYVNGEKTDYPALKKEKEVSEEELPKDIVLYVNFSDKESCELIKQIKDRQFNGFIKALLRARVSVDFSVFFSSEIKRKEPSLIKETVKEEKKEEKPKQIGNKKEENISKTEEIKEKTEKKESVIQKEENSDNSSSDFDMMSCLAGMFENF